VHHHESRSSAERKARALAWRRARHRWSRASSARPSDPPRAFLWDVNRRRDRHSTRHRRTNDGVLQRREIEQVEDGLDIGELVLARDVARLPEQRRELEGFSDGCEEPIWIIVDGDDMQVYALAVGS
jgi:hypothetical protein